MSNPLWIVLDDNDDIIDIVQTVCRIWEVDLVTLRDGYEAMKWIADFRARGTNRRIPELALLDLRMPGPQGDEVAQTMRKLDALSNMAIVIMTAHVAEPKEQERIMQLTDADAFIVKPLPRLFEFNRITQQAIEQRKEKVDTSSLNPS
jgi:CheY-like chemotaxis protein